MPPNGVVPQTFSYSLFLAHVYIELENVSRPKQQKVFMMVISDLRVMSY
jgi:hypothetical protein